jgi:ABC-type transport system involved in cytochrome c biogenesis ATPase subunit
MTTQLCPVQQQAFDALSSGLSAGNVFVLSGDNGMGKTTVLLESPLTGSLCKPNALSQNAKTC